jgi:hypothetical protein
MPPILGFKKSRHFCSTDRSRNCGEMIASFATSDADEDFCAGNDIANEILDRCVDELRHGISSSIMLKIGIIGLPRPWWRTASLL